MSDTPGATRQEIVQAYWDNVRNNQIGGQTDGVSEEVMADVGFETRDQVVQILAALDQPKPERAPVRDTRDLSIAEMNANERRAIARHLGLVTKQVMDPASYRYFRAGTRAGRN